MKEHKSIEPRRNYKSIMSCVRASEIIKENLCTPFSSHN